MDAQNKQPLVTAGYINKLNKIKVLHLIREEGEISRADIVKRTGLSAPTITRNSDDLINKENLVSMAGMGQSSGGRRPKILRFNSKNNYVVGIDLGTTFVRGAISNLDGEFIMEREVPTEINKGFEGVMRQIANLIDTLTSRELAKGKTVLGVGLAVAGLINKQTGIIEYSPVFDWKNVNVKAELRKYLSLPVFYDNVSRLTALGELWYGIGKSHDNFISVNLGYGIGAGIIAGGKPFYGADGYAGEFGHMVLDSDSPMKGREGIAGTLEALSSGYGIAETAKMEVQKDNSGMLSSKHLAQDEITAKAVIEAAKLGDKLALQIFDNAIMYLGVGIDGLIKLFNPEKIVLSGGLTLSGDFLMDKLKKSISQHSMGNLSRKVEIVYSTFGENATLMGAFSMILIKVLNLEIDNNNNTGYTS